MTDYRILITGSRDMVDPTPIEDAIREELDLASQLDPPPTRVIVVHGAGRGRNGAPGADQLADDIAARWQIPRDPHPADWDRYGKAAGPIRNAEMVDAGANVCRAFPIGESIGTWGCVKLARAAGIRVEVYGGVAA